MVQTKLKTCLYLVLLGTETGGFISSVFLGGVLFPERSSSSNTERNFLVNMRAVFFLLVLSPSSVFSRFLLLELSPCNLDSAFSELSSLLSLELRSRWTEADVPLECLLSLEDDEDDELEDVFLSLELWGLEEEEEEEEEECFFSLLLCRCLSMALARSRSLSLSFSLSRRFSFSLSYSFRFSSLSLSLEDDFFFLSV